MTHIIGLKLADDSAKAIADFIRHISHDNQGERLPRRWGNFQPIHPNYPKIIPIGRRKQEQPSVLLHEKIELGSPYLHVFNEHPRNQHSSLQLLFKNDYVQNRMFEMAGIDPALASKGARKRNKPRILLGFFCHSYDMGWIKHLPVKELTVVEQVSIPFDPEFPHYCHEYVAPPPSPWEIGALAS